MAKAPKDNSDWMSLPVLTEVVGDVQPEIPTLIEEAAGKLARGNSRNNEVVEMSAEEIAALLAPQLERQLREKMREQFEVLWQETWLQARASLPELIYAQLKQGNKAPALDIIAPHSAAPATKKSGTGKTVTVRAKDGKSK
jgi:hypothetical protein